MAVTIRDVITLPISSSIRREARRVALLKNPHFNDTFELRQPPQRLRNIYIGDMATLAIKEWLEQNGFTVDRWDEVRNDNFTSSDKDFDLRVNNKQIESRSSVQTASLQYLINNRNIMQPTYADIKRITIQSYWSKDNYDEVNLMAWTLKRHLENAQVVRIRNLNNQDFYMMHFTDTNANPMNQLLTYL